MSFFGPFAAPAPLDAPFAPLTDEGVDGVATGELLADVDGEACEGELIW